MRLPDICPYLGPADRAQLRALLSIRNTPRWLAWRAGIVLATADDQGTVEIMRRTGMSKPTVRRWQERYLDEGVAGPKRSKTRPSRGAAAAQRGPAEGDRENCAGNAARCHADVVPEI